jgi:putative methyltransferase (TIGR04325 family)
MYKNSSIKSIFFIFIKNVIPPFLLTLLKKLSPSKSIRFLGPFDSWNTAAVKASGYDNLDVLSAVRRSALKVKNGEATYERDSALFDKIQYAWPVLSVLLWVANLNKSKLKVLDFGGALGTSYRQNSRFLSSIENLSWAVVEQPNFVDCGRKDFQNEELRFFYTVKDAITETSPNLVLISSVLQYIENYEDILKNILIERIPIVILDRVSVNLTDTDIVYLQVVPSSIYNASYPCFMISQGKLLDFFQKNGYSLLESFESLNFPELQSVKALNIGYIFRLDQ